MGSNVFQNCNELLIYCEASSKPDGWDDNWDSVYGTTPCDVVWADNTPVTEIAANAVSIYAHGNTIVVENATDAITISDALGRIVGSDDARTTSAEKRKFTVPSSGVYVVKIGNCAVSILVR